MNKEDVYIPGMTNPDDAMMHGRKWSEEAKARVRAARKAGRTVEEMFGKNWKKAGKAGNKMAKQTGKSFNSAKKKVRILTRNAEKSVNKSANKIANKTIYKSKINKLQKTKRRVDKRMNGVISSNKKVSKSSDTAYDKRVAKSQISMAKDKKNLYNKLLKKNKNHSTSQIVKDGAKYLLKKADKDTGKLLKKADNGVTNLINERAYNKDKAVTTKAEREQIKKGLVKANKNANSVRDKTYKKEVTKNGNTGVDGFKKKLLNKKAYNKTESKATSKAEKARNATLRKGQKKAVESVNNANKYKSTGDFINKQKKKLVDNAVTAVAAHNVDKNTKRNGGSVSSRSNNTKYKPTFTKTIKTRKKYAKLARESQIADEKKRIKKRFGIKQSATDNVYIPGLTGSSDAYLQHYGKLGMKWGKRSGGGMNGKKPSVKIHKKKSKEDDMKFLNEYDKVEYKLAKKKLNRGVVASTAAMTGMGAFHGSVAGSVAQPGVGTIAGAVTGAALYGGGTRYAAGVARKEALTAIQNKYKRDYFENDKVRKRRRTVYAGK